MGKKNKASCSFDIEHYSSVDHVGLRDVHGAHRWTCSTDCSKDHVSLSSGLILKFCKMILLFPLCRTEESRNKPLFSLSFPLFSSGAHDLPQSLSALGMGHTLSSAVGLLLFLSSCSSDPLLVILFILETSMIQCWPYQG